MSRASGQGLFLQEKPVFGLFLPKCILRSHFFFFSLARYYLEAFSTTSTPIGLENQNLKVKTRVLSFKNRILCAFIFNI